MKVLEFLFLAFFCFKMAVSLWNFNWKLPKIDPKIKASLKILVFYYAKLLFWALKWIGERNILDSKSIAIPVLIWKMALGQFWLGNWWLVLKWRYLCWMNRKYEVHSNKDVMCSLLIPLVSAVISQCTEYFGQNICCRSNTLKLYGCEAEGVMKGLTQ